MVEASPQEYLIQCVSWPTATATAIATITSPTIHLEQPRAVTTIAVAKARAETEQTTIPIKAEGVPLSYPSPGAPDKDE